MADSAALLVDDVLPHQPMRQWVLSVPFPLRFLFASHPRLLWARCWVSSTAPLPHIWHTKRVLQRLQLSPVQWHYKTTDIHEATVTDAQRADYNGVFAPNCKYRALVTPANRSRGKKVKSLNKAPDQTPAEKRASMTWAQRLKRVFSIDIETCDKCGGDVRIIASIEDPVVIRQILNHLDAKLIHAELLPQCRAPPGIEFSNDV